MNTILSRLPLCIEKYPLSSKMILNDFLDVLQHYEEADYNRDILSQHLTEFKQKYYETEAYFQTPFLWFAHNYFTYANLLLSIGKFHADEFYEYLVKMLRGYDEIKGVFRLLCESTSLSDLAWEQLQYACTKLIPMTPAQLHCLEVINSYIAEAGISSLNSNRLKDIIRIRVRNLALSRNLSSFFTRLEASWHLWFYLPALGLESLYFQFQLNKSTSLSEIIDILDPQNKTFGLSQIFTVRGYSNNYIGLFVVPSHLIERLQAYIKVCERKGKLNLHDMSRVTSRRISSSFTLYRADKGWYNFTETEWKRLSQPLKTAHPRKRRSRSLHFFLSPPFNDNFSYFEQSNANQIISLYCKLPSVFSYYELPLGSSQNHKTIELSRSELDLLTDLYENHVVRVFFTPHRLNNDFSLDFYWIKIPHHLKMSQLSRVLELVPYCVIIYTDYSIHLWTWLRPQLVHWLSVDLEWEVIPVLFHHYPSNPDIEWYNLQSRQWKTPSILK